MKPFDQNIHDQAEEKVRNLMDAAIRGASDEELEDLLDKPQTFREAVGEVAMFAPKYLAYKAVEACAKGPGPDEYLTKKADQVQKNCDDFFCMQAVSSWIIARSLKADHKRLSWSTIDSCFMDWSPIWPDFRTNWWGYVVWSFEVNDIVESLHGPNSCTSELFDKTWDGRDESCRINYLKSLTPAQIAYWRCTD